MPNLKNRRILLVDDLPSIHADFRKILTNEGASLGLGKIEALLFNETTSSKSVYFELDSAYQGEEGVTKVALALESKKPYAMAFVDMRMPPGIDGVETIEKIWQIDPRIQIVVCTAHSDYSWEEMVNRLDVRDRLLILKKPFDVIEIRQLASTLTAKWEGTQRAILKIEALDESMMRTTQLVEAEARERKLLESQLIQSEKLASIGQLAAGVAHEINNPLGFIFSNLNTLETYHERLFEMLAAYEKSEEHITPPDVNEELILIKKHVELDYLKEDMPVLMKESKEGVNRVSKIIRDLKDFSRVDSADKWEWVDIHQGIDSTLNIIAIETKYKADIIKHYGKLPEVECLSSQINQVVMNLVINAVDASRPEERGQITIRTWADTDWVWIEVEDKGSGIPSEVLSRIFDPFFTTKPVGKGTGLGLSLCYGIIQKHHGTIDVHSEVGKGTTFKVKLPIKRVLTE